MAKYYLPYEIVNAFFPIEAGSLQEARQKVRAITAAQLAEHGESIGLLWTDPEGPLTEEEFRCVSMPNGGMP